MQHTDIPLERILLASSAQPPAAAIMTPALEYSLRHNRSDQVSWLLTQTQEIDSQSGVVWHAVFKRDFPLLKALIERGANPHLAYDSLWEYNLLESAAYADLSMVEYLFGLGLTFRPTLIMNVAAINPDPRIANFFWQRGAALDTPACPLCLAVRFDRRETFYFLLAKGADIQALVETENTSIKGLSALQIASLYARYELAEALLAHGAKFPGNLIYAMANNPAALKQRKRPANPAVDPDWQAALHNYAQLIALFMRQGMDINGKVYGETSLIAALKQKQLDFVRLLLKAGANPNLADAFGHTPLEIAKQQGLNLREFDSLFCPTKEACP
ncbi:MAG: ankyrin repeat domain-containing protein [Candidatus Sericytochromatia bacterium]